MALQALTLKMTPGPNISGTQTAIAWTAAAAATSFTLPITGKEILLVRNTGGAPASVTIKATADGLGRAVDAVHSLAAGEVKIFGPFVPLGWAQTDGLLYIEMTTTGLQAAAILLP